MSSWKATLKIADVFRNHDLTLSEKASKIRVRLIPIGRAVDPGSDYLDELLDELSDAAEAADVKWFDTVWDAVYDWADENRVWIEIR